MKFAIVLLAFVAAASAQHGRFQQVPNYGGQDQIPIISKSFDLHEDGSYQWAYETGNGITANENGIGGQYAKGSADWTTPEGEHVFIQYTADENGYQPSGSHVPQIPPYIARALEYIRTHPPPPEYPNRKF